MNREKLRTILARATVGIAGAGGLGSNCAVSLARAGVKKFIVADFDVVSEANLDRQYYFRNQVGRRKVEALAENLAGIDPGVITTCRFARLVPELVREFFAGCDVLIEALDDAGAKTMFIETALEAFPGTPVIGAAGLAGIGHFEALTILRHGNLYLCGDFEREVSEELPPIAPRVAIVANMEADTALGLLLERLGDG